jgi:hypothetical protein
LADHQSYPPRTALTCPGRVSSLARLLVAGAPGEVGPVHTGRRAGARHRAHFALQDPDRQMQRLQDN